MMEKSILACKRLLKLPLKLAKYPVFEFQDKEAFLEKQSKLINTKTISLNQILKSSVNASDEKIGSDTKVG